MWTSLLMLPPRFEEELIYVQALVRPAPGGYLESDTENRAVHHWAEPEAKAGRTRDLSLNTGAVTLSIEPLLCVG